MSFTASQVSQEHHPLQENIVTVAPQLLNGRVYLLEKQPCIITAWTKIPFH